MKNCFLTQKKSTKAWTHRKKGTKCLQSGSRSAHSSWGRLKRTLSKLSCRPKGQAPHRRCWETEIQRQETMQTGSRNTQQIPRLLWTPRFPYVWWDFVTQGQKKPRPQKLTAPRDSVARKCGSSTLRMESLATTQSCWEKDELCSVNMPPEQGLLQTHSFKSSEKR